MKFSRAIGCFLALLALLLLVGETEGTLYAVGPDKETSRAILYKVDDVTGASSIVNVIHNNTDDGTIYFSGKRRFHSLAYDSFRGHLVGLVRHRNINYGSEMLFIDERTGRVLKTYPATSSYAGTLAIDGSGRIYVAHTDQGGIWYIMGIDITTGRGTVIGSRYRPGICCPHGWFGMSVAFDDNDVLHLYSGSYVGDTGVWHWIVDRFTGAISRQQPAVSGIHFATESGDVRPHSQLLYAPGITGYSQENKIQIVNLEEKAALPWFISTNIPIIDALAFDRHSGARLDDDCVFGLNIPLKIDVAVPYYGDTQKLVANGLISEVAVLHVAAYDIEYNPTRPSPSNGTVHHVYFNDDEVGNLTGSPRKWKMNMFSIPLETIVFPEEPQKGETLDPGMNEVRIEVAGTGTVECIKVDKVELTIDKVPRPVLLVHGINANKDMWLDSEGTQRWPNHLTALGIPFDGNISLGDFNSIEHNALNLGMEIADARRRWGVEKLNIVSYSKGGLDSRHYIENHDDIAQLIQIATPNGGSPIVDWINLSLVELALLFGLNPASTLLLVLWANLAPIAAEFGAGIVQLSVTHMGGYNSVHGYNPNVRYTVLAGDCRPDCLKYPSNCIMNLLVGAGDGVVPAMSAFALDYTSDEFLYSSTSLDASHGSEDEGLPQSGYVLNKLIGYIEDSFFYERLPRRLSRENPPNRQLSSSSVQSFTVAGTVALGEVFEFPLEFDLSPEAYVLFAYTSGHLIFNLTHSQEIEEYKYQGNKTEIYRLLDIKEGSWVASVTGAIVEQVSVDFVTIVLLSGSPITLQASLEKDSVPIGSPLTYLGTLTQEGKAPVTGANVSAIVATPDDDLEVISLQDDGIAPDKVADDGIYTGQFFDTNMPGNYHASIIADSNVPVSFFREKYVLGIVTAGSLILGDNFSDEGADDNSDGYFDRLVVKVSVDANATGLYRIFGEFTDSVGNSQTTGFDAELESGVNSVQVAFDGREIFRNQVDGPYFLTALRLAEERELSIALLAEMNEIYETAVYSFRDFQHDPIHLWKSSVETHGTDIDGDGFYDLLQVEVSVDVQEEGVYHWSATLQDTNGTEIGEYLSESTNLTSGTHTIAFEFNGTLIAENGVDGPFSVAELIIYSGGFYSIFVTGSAFETGPMNADEFDPCPNDRLNACIGAPTAVPSQHPTKAHSLQPSEAPSVEESGAPSLQPSEAPSEEKSEAPSLQSSEAPSSVEESEPPSLQSSEAPSEEKSEAPSLQPSVVPSVEESEAPPVQPSEAPSVKESEAPSLQPSLVPSVEESVVLSSPTKGDSEFFLFTILLFPIRAVLRLWDLLIEAFTN